MRKILGFTLAEVLITLAIIGIVAALTIPTLVNNYQKKTTVVKLRKVFSDLNNAAKLSEAANGSMDTWKFPASSSNDEMEDFIKTYYLPYFRAAQYYSGTDFNKIGYTVADLTGNASGYKRPGLVLSDGVVLTFQAGGSYLWLFADINGIEGPNRAGRDVFVFDAYSYLKRDRQGNSKYYIDFWSTGMKDRNYFTADNNYGCNSKNTHIYSGWTCGTLIQYDGWKISDDYPW